MADVDGRGAESDTAAASTCQYSSKIPAEAALEPPRPQEDRHG